MSFLYFILVGKSFNLTPNSPEEREGHKNPGDPRILAFFHLYQISEDVQHPAEALYVLNLFHSDLSRLHLLDIKFWDWGIDNQCGANVMEGFHSWLV